MIIKFNIYSQDILSALGSPNKMFYKAEDKVSVSHLLHHTLK